MHENDIIVVLTHVPNQNCAERIANALIKDKLAACVNIGGTCQSIYEWQGKVEAQTEISIHIKTNQGCYTKVETFILEAHPYELPDIIVLNVCGGFDQYLQWVTAQLSH